MKKEWKAFFFVLLVNFLFSQIVGDDNLNRIFFSIAIAKNKTLLLDEYSHFISDVIKTNKGYISTKSPGLSFLLFPFSFVVESIFPSEKNFQLLKESLQYKKLTVTNLSFSQTIISLLALFLFSSLPGALIFLILFRCTKNIYLSLLLYFSSPLFPYSTTLFPYTFSIFLILLAFIKKHRILTPLLLALSTFFEFTAIFLAFLVFMYLRKRINLFYFLVGMLPILAYCFAFPSAISYLLGLTTLGYFRFSSLPFISLSSFNSHLPLLSLLFLFFSPYRGFFFYFPLFPLFFLYFKSFKRDYRLIAILSIFIYSFFNSFLSYWWGSTSFGPRHMIYCIPFILLAFSSAWKKVNKRLFFVVTFLSLFLSFSSFTYWEGARKIGKGGKEIYITGIYGKGEINFSNEYQLALFSPLLSHYIPSLVKNGPRSKLLESLFTERPFDLRYLLPEERDYLSRIYPYPPYLAALVLLILSFAFFWSEIRSRKTLLFAILLAITVISLYNLHYFGFFDSFRKINKVELKFGFYPRDVSGSLFVYKRGIIYIFSNTTEEKAISLVLTSFIEDRNITIFLNGAKIGNYNVNSNYDTRIAFLYPLKEGKNKLEIISNNCVRPIQLNTSDDKRCISLSFKSIEISSLNKEEPIFSEGWFIQNKSLIYAGKYGKMYIYSEGNPAIISMELASFLKDRNISVYLNSELIGTPLISKEGSKVDLISNFIEGINTLEIKSEDCSIPSEEDKRCLSIRIFNISIKPLDTSSTSIIFSNGWCIPEDGNYWMGVKAKLNIFSSFESKTPSLLVFEARSFGEDRNAKFYLNGDLIADVTINKDFEKIFSIPLKLSKGINNVMIISEKCLRPKDLGYSNDTRCLSLLFKSFKILNMSEEKPILSEILPSRDSNVKWVSKSSKIYIYSSNEKEYLLFVNMTSFLKDREVSFYLNSNLVDKLNIFKEGEEVYLPIKLKNGINTLEIKSEDCSIPSEEDKRCLSIGIASISLISLEEAENQIIFSKSWYYKAKEDNYRWGTDSLQLLYISPANTTVTFYFDILPIYNETTIVEFYLNGELKNIFEIARGGGWVYTLPQRVKKGINYLEFKIPKGCVVIDDILHNGDKRCIAMTLRGIMVKK